MRAFDFFRATTPDQPFCLTVAFKEPHGPFNYFDPNVPNPYEGVKLPPSPTFTLKDWNGQPEFIRNSLNGDRDWLRNPDAYQRDLRTFYRTVTRADEAVGRMLSELERLGLDDNTVVIFSSDHGSLLGDHGLSGKWLMYENSIRVPMIIYDPRIDPRLAGQRRDEMVLSIDIAPTLLALAGIEPPESMQGENVMSLVRDESRRWRSHFYYQHTYNTDPPRSPIAESEGVRTQRWKYIRYPEQHNLASDEEHESITTRLRALCDKRSTSDEPVP